MGFLTEHQHTYITDTIDRVVGSEREVLEVELGKLIEMIRSGSEYEFVNNQLEAARAMRKQLKYGHVSQQLRTLDLLNLFVSQLVDFPVMLNDSKLLERLEGIAMESEKDARGHVYTKAVVKKAVGYILAWTNFVNAQASESKTYSQIVRLGGIVRRNYIKKTERSRKPSKKERDRGGSENRRNNFMNDSADHSIHPDDAMYQIPKINLDKESSGIKLLISDALATAISLQNALLGLPKGESSVENKTATMKFTEARDLRRKVLRYLQLITGGELLGPLIHANEELVKALTRYDELAGYNSSASSPEESESDSDSEPSDSERHRSRLSSTKRNVDNPFDDENQI